MELLMKKEESKKIYTGPITGASGYARGGVDKTPKGAELTETLTEALNKFQQENINAVKANDNPFYKSTYADLTSVINAVNQGAKFGYDYNKMRDRFAKAETEEDFAAAEEEFPVTPGLFKSRFYDMKADGGRIGYQNAGPVMPGQPMQASTPMNQEETNQINISYEQLRERLPPEISNDIVLLLSQIYEAFADFAEIQTQADVNEFNTKYNVQLFLPKQAGA